LEIESDNSIFGIMNVDVSLTRLGLWRMV